MLLFGLTSLLATATARGQDLIAEQLYGSGVHRYFSGNLSAARSDFTSAIQTGTNDPRPYYFRALTYLRQGFTSQAAADLQRAADLEAMDINDSYQVSKALQRVQGGLRLQLERHRRQARIVAQQRQEQQRRQRAAAARRYEAERVQQAGAMEPEQPRGRAAASPDVDALFRQEARSPFSAGPAQSVEDASAPSRQPASPPANTFARPPVDDNAPLASPFGGPPAAERLPAGGASPFRAPSAEAEAPADASASPFGGPPAAPDAETEPPAADSANPFGAPLTPATPADSPTAPAEAPPDGAGPFGTTTTRTVEPAEAGSTPFGSATAPPDAGGDASANPFGTPVTPADAAGTANPFGGPPAASATPDMPSDRPPPAGGQNGAANSSASGGLFRALRRATGIDAAIGAAGSAAKSLPIGGPGPQTPSPPNTIRPAGSTFTMPPGAGGVAPGTAPDQANPINETAPGNAPPADANNPFGAPAAAPADAGNPFGGNPFGAPPAADMQPDAATDANPFQDDPVQPEPNPAGGAR